MKFYKVRTYISTDYTEWNAFIGKAKNATFLFHRDFMEYHKDRFDDFSLMIFENEKLVAVLPANKKENEVFSHQGLTYGGLVFAESFKGSDLNEILEAVFQFLKDNSISKLTLKPILSFYTSADYIQYESFLIQKNGQLFRRDLNLAIDFSKPLQVSKSKLKHFRKTVKLGLELRQETVFDTFWNQILEPRLQEKYQAKPVHNLKEITKLHHQFPDKILQYNAYFEGELLAGVTLFHSEKVIKSQYGATSEKGEKLRALDFIFISLIEKYKDSVNFFDMGTVTEMNGKSYNKGLLQQKEELGCTIYNQDFYSIEL
ncbi:MAG: FemAB family protein [Flavobacterium sp.]